MTRVKIVLEFDEEDLGPEWLNPDNFAALLYSTTHTTLNLLRIVTYANTLRRVKEEAK